MVSSFEISDVSSSRGFLSYTMLIGLQDISSSLDYYVLYYTLIESVGCDFTKAYGLTITIYSFVQLFWWPFLGWICDHPLVNVTIMLRISCCLFSVLYVVMILVAQHSLVWFNVIYNLRWMSGNMLWTCVWKLFKSQISFLHVDKVHEEQIINSVSSLGDIYSQFIAVAVLIVCYLLLHFASHLLSQVFIYISVLSICLSMCWICFSLKVDKRGVDISSENLVDIDSTLLRNRNDVNYTETNIWERLYAVFSIRVISYCFVHAVIMNIAISLFQTPIAFSLSLDDKVTDPLCDLRLMNLLTHAVFLQSAYLIIGPLFYKFFRITEPELFYGKVFPLFLTAVIALCFTLFFPVPRSISFIFSAIVTSISYYLNSFNFYVISAWVPLESSSFLQSSYYLSNVFVGFITGAITGLSIPFFPLLLTSIFCFILAAILCFYLQKIFREVI